MVSRLLSGSSEVTVCVAGDAEVKVDLAACSLHSELLAGLWVRTRCPKRLELARFPGGMPLLNSVLKHIRSAASGKDAAGEQPDFSALSHPPLAQESLGSYLEAAVLLGSARLLRELAHSSVCEELTSRQALPVLEQAVALTEMQETCKADDGEVTMSGSSELMEGALVVAIQQLSARVDSGDLRLGPPLATGSTRASIEVLRVYRSKREDVRDLLSASISGSISTPANGLSSPHGTSMASSAVSTSAMSRARINSRLDPSSKRVEWSEHQFSCHTLRAHLAKGTEVAQAAGEARKPQPKPDLTLPGSEPDNEPEAVAVDSDSLEGGSEVCEESWEDHEDIPEELCDAAPDALLKRLADIVKHLDSQLTPPVLAALSVRALLLVDKDGDADSLFQVAFARSVKLRAMLVSREVPVLLLRTVVRHREASIVLRQVLAKYESMPHGEVCSLIEKLYFGVLSEEEHSHRAIAQHTLMRHLVLWMRSGGAPDGSRRGALGFRGVDAADEEVSRLRTVGERLFGAAFVPHNGFLPPGGAQQGEAGAACLWDAGELDLCLLERVPQTEDALQLVRHVLLRIFCLRRLEEDATGLAHLWRMGRWERCQDPALISQAFELLKHAWRHLDSLPGRGDLAGPRPPEASGAAEERRSNGSSVRAAEELLLRLFTDLEVWRLPSKALLTPWVPGQVLVSHITAQCRELEDRQKALVEESRQNKEEIARLTSTIEQLSGRLEATDGRSQQCMQRQADVNETVRRLS